MTGAPHHNVFPRSTGAASVAARIGFDSAATTRVLALLVHPGSGAPHQVVVDVEGQDPSGDARSVRATVSDPLGQTHLTAVGALVQLERLLGLDGAAPPPPGLHYPDSAPQLQAARRTLDQFGVAMTLT